MLIISLVERLKQLSFLSTVTIALSLVSLTYGQEYGKHNYITNEVELPYRVLLPEGYEKNSQKMYPLIIFLHGIGERGSDNELQLVHCSDFFKKDYFREKWPSIVVYPQCPSDSHWSKVKNRFPNPYKFYKRKRKNKQLDVLEDFIEYVENTYPINKNQIYIGGLSMGGMGTLEMIFRNPDKFAAAFSFCGGADPSWSRKIKSTPLWLMHGEKDDVISYKFSKELYNTLLQKKAKVKYTHFPNHGHLVWNAAIEEKSLFPWLFSHKRNHSTE